MHTCKPPEIFKIKEHCRNHDQKCCGTQDQFTLQPVFLPLKTIQINVFPCQKADSTYDCLLYTSYHTSIG